MMNRLKRVLPGPAYKSIAQTLYAGKKRFCPVCNNWVREFLQGGLNRRPDAKCPICSSVERHRLAMYFLIKRANLLTDGPKTFLHIAPETSLSLELGKITSLNYLTADLHNPNVKIQMDITNIQFPDASFDVIFCSHVLEHVLDDRQALREFYRTLQPNGWALLSVPFDATADSTFEDATIVTPEARLKYFGQSDHVRLYGRDFADRVRESGFSVTEYSAQEIAGAEGVVTMELKDERLWHCVKLSE